jgi:hypothetical protein
MRMFFRLPIFLSLLMASLSVSGNPLPKEGKEYKQLEAMGYELEEIDDVTIASRASTAIMFRKMEKYLYAGRIFKVKSFSSLSPAEKMDVLTTINSANAELSLTVFYGDQVLNCGIHIYGAYSPSTFGTAVSDIEMCNILFDKYPKLLNLNP